MKQVEDDVTLVGCIYDWDVVLESNYDTDIQQANTCDRLVGALQKDFDTADACMPRFSCKCECTNNYDNDFIAEQLVQSSALSKEQLDA